MIQKSPVPQFFILFLLVSFGSVGAVLFTPALPSIQAFFQISIGITQLTITSYLLGCALGPLLYGPLANGIGRKKTLYAGVSLAMIGSLFCALSGPLHSFGLLICARFVQALGACVGLKVSFTMVADVYDQKDASRIISKLLMAFAMMPGIAIAIGGLLVQWIGWESCFYFLTLFGLSALYLISLLPETAKSIDLSALAPRAIIQGYRLKLKNRCLLLSGLIMGCGTAAIYVFASKAPFIGMNLIGLEPGAFGFLNFIPAIGMFLGSVLSAWLVGRFMPLKLLQMAIIASVIMTLPMLFSFIMIGPQIWSLFLPIALIYIVESVVFANISSFGLAIAKNKSNASAVLNSLNIGTAVVAVFLSELIYPELPILLPITLVVLFFVMFLLYSRLNWFFKADKNKDK